MIQAGDIVQRFYTYYEKSRETLNYSPLHDVGLRNNCYLMDSMRDTYCHWRDKNSTTKIKRM